MIIKDAVPNFVSGELFSSSCIEKHNHIDVKLTMLDIEILR